MIIVRINKNGTMNDLKIDLNNSNLLTKLKKISTSNGSGDIKELYFWSYDNKKIKCYGWYDGDSGFENKHELIPNGTSSFLEENSSEQLLFGDIFMIAFDEINQLIDYCVSDYAILFDYMCEGFDDCYDSDDSENTNSDSSQISNTENNINDFIINDNKSDSNSSSSYNDNNEQLELDENDYDSYDNDNDDN